MARRPLPPHPNALEGHLWAPRDGRVCGRSGGLVTGLVVGRRQTWCQAGEVARGRDEEARNEIWEVKGGWSALTSGRTDVGTYRRMHLQLSICTWSFRTVPRIVIQWQYRARTLAQPPDPPVRFVV